MITIGEVLKLSADYLQKKGVEHPRRTAEELLAHLLKKERIALYMNFDQPLIEEELQTYRALIKRASLFEPLAYILGSVSFFHTKLFIDPSCLIPRPETEILVSLIVSDLKNGALQGKHFLDLCSGSGCVAIAVKKALPELNVTATDISSKATALIRKNAAENGVEISVVEGDFFQPLAGKKFDYIAFNPPYIKEGDYVGLSPSVKQFEPVSALIGGKSGLEFYERFAKESLSHLNAGAKLFFEIGYDQGKEVKELFSGASWKGQEIKKDWGGHDRFFFLEIQ